MIICCGEALIDMLPRVTTEGEQAFAPYAGGAVFNTAIALGRLGIRTGLFTGLSTDMFGDTLRQTLHASSVDYSLCAVSDRPTTLAFVKLTDGHASYAFFDENTAGRMIATDDLPDLDESVEALHFGAISLMSEPCGSTYEELMRRAADYRVISLDPNIRPTFIKDRDAHLARMKRMIAMSDVIKLSDEDLAWFGYAGGAEAAARDWLTGGASIVIVTRGANGAEAYCRQGKVDVPGLKVTVADTVGAGDTVNAGVLAGLKSKSFLTKKALASISTGDLAYAVSLGMKAAAVTVSRPGANPPYADEIGFQA